MFHGSCCCGDVRFAISEAPGFAAACHCSRCRKLGATPFAIVRAEHFELLEGRERIVQYEPGPDFTFTRAFCGRCGTSLGEIGSGEAMFPVPLHCFDDETGARIRFHEHVATKPSWESIPEGVPQFPGDPPKSGG